MNGMRRQLVTQQVMVMILRAFAFLVFVIFTSACFGFSDYSRSSSVFLRGGWEVAAYQAMNADYSVNPARLCFIKNNKTTCYLITKKHRGNQYPFQMVTDLVVLPNDSGIIGVLVNSEHTGTVDGLSAIDIWVYDTKQSGFVNILQNYVLAGMGGYRLLSNVTTRSGNGLILVTAERIWRADEAIDGAHVYKIVVYRISDKSSRMVHEYKTSKLYGGEGVKVQSIIDAELPEILKAAL